MFNRATGQYTMSQNKQRYTCVSKPGEYELVGTSSGAGTLKGLPVIVYRDATSGRLFHREPENFMARMKKIQSEQTDINAELLAALEGLLKASTGENMTATEVGTAHHQAIITIAKAKGGPAFGFGKTIAELQQDGYLSEATMYECGGCGNEHPKGTGKCPTTGYPESGEAGQE